MTSLQLDLPLVLPEVLDTEDGCVGRLESAMRTYRGIGAVHVVSVDGGPPRLCLHYDPDIVTLAQVERHAYAAARCHCRYGQ
jgi:Cd2+/Zn2+-exporting ATPase